MRFYIIDASIQSVFALIRSIVLGIWFWASNSGSPVKLFPWRMKKKKGRKTNKLQLLCVIYTFVLLFVREPENKTEFVLFFFESHTFTWTKCTISCRVSCIHVLAHRIQHFIIYFAHLYIHQIGSICRCLGHQIHDLIKFNKNAFGFLLCLWMRVNHLCVHTNNIDLHILFINQSSICFCSNRICICNRLRLFRMSGKHSFDSKQSSEFVIRFRAYLMITNIATQQPHLLLTHKNRMKSNIRWIMHKLVLVIDNSNKRFREKKNLFVYWQAYW